MSRTPFLCPSVCPSVRLFVCYTCGQLCDSKTNFNPTYFIRLQFSIFVIFHVRWYLSTLNFLYPSYQTLHASIVRELDLNSHALLIICHQIFTIIEYLYQFHSCKIKIYFYHIFINWFADLGLRSLQILDSSS